MLFPQLLFDRQYGGGTPHGISGHILVALESVAFDNAVGTHYVDKGVGVHAPLKLVPEKLFGQEAVPQGVHHHHASVEPPQPPLREIHSGVAFDVAFGLDRKSVV